jgi:hypothetical protein
LGPAPCAHVAWRRATKVGVRHNLSSTIMTRLAGALFVYIDELASMRSLAA